jgi:hypothetical protein
MGDSHKERTHVAFGFRREGKKSGRLVEIGTGHFDADRTHAHLYLDRTPLNGFTGYIFLMPKGEKLPATPPPQESDDEDSEA